jgi:ankyrin repeat protein
MAFLPVIAGAPVLAKASDVIAVFNKLTLKRNYGKAAAVLLEAAKQGDSEAQFRLAGLYRMGLGVPQNDQQAVHWASQSASAGNADAAEMLARWSTTGGKTQMETAGAPAVAPETPRISGTARNSLDQPWILAAAARGQNAILQSMLAGGGAANAADSGGTTSLMAAVASGSAAAVLSLLQAGADPNAADALGRTALMLAAARQPSIIPALLEAKANTDLRDKNGDDALNYAAGSCQPGAAATLAAAASGMRSKPPAQTAGARAILSCNGTAVLAVITNLASVHDADASGRTALWYAAATGKQDAADILLAAGANPNAADENGLTPLHMAAAFARPALLKAMLAKGGDSSVRSSAGDTALHFAATAQCSACVSALKPTAEIADIQNEAGDSALIIATRLGDDVLVKQLLNAGADDRLRNTKRETVRSIAKARKFSTILDALN